MNFLVAFIGFSVVLGLAWGWIALYNMWHQIPQYNSLDRNILKVGFGMLAVLTTLVAYLIF